jgi:hypothetical protein
MISMLVIAVAADCAFVLLVVMVFNIRWHFDCNEKPLGECNKNYDSVENFNLMSNHEPQFNAMDCKCGHDYELIDHEIFNQID